MKRTNVLLTKTKVLHRYGTLLNFSKKFNIPLHQLYRAFKTPMTDNKIKKLLEFEDMLKKDTHIPLSRSKVKKIIRSNFGNVHQFCDQNNFNYSHVVRFLSGTITKLNPNIEVMVHHLKKHYDINLALHDG